MLFSVEKNSMIPNPNLRVFVSEPTYTEKILKEAFEYYKPNKSIIKLKNDNEYAYFIPAGETTELNKEECRNYVTKKL